RKSYDLYDRLIKVEEMTPTGAKVAQVMTYDNSGNILSMTDANGNTTTYQYTPFGQIGSVVDPEGNLTEYKYTESGLLSEIDYADDRRFLKQYDSLGRLIKEQRYARPINAAQYSGQSITNQWQLYQTNSNELVTDWQKGWSIEGEAIHANYGKTFGSQGLVNFGSITSAHSDNGYGHNRLSPWRAAT